MPEITWTEMRYLPVPLTPDELRERGEMLATLVDEADALEDDHVQRRREAKDEEKRLDGRIRAMAAVINARAEGRSVKIEVRYNATLALIEEVRIDTGEVLETRQPTSDDKARAQLAAQPGLL